MASVLVRGLAAHQRRLIGSRDHDHGAGKTGFAEVVLKEFLHLAAALANEPDHGDVGGDVARQHGQQHRFADAGAGEDAQTLAAAAGQKGIERADAEIERGADAAARVRQRRRVAERIRRRPVEQRALAVDRLAQRIDDPAEPADGRPHRTGDGGDHGLAAAPNAFERRKRHQQGITRGKPDHLAGDRLRRRLNNDARANRHRMQGTGDFDHQAAHADHAAVDLDAVEFVDLLSQCLHRKSVIESPSVGRIWLLRTVRR